MLRLIMKSRMLLVVFFLLCCGWLGGACSRRPLPSEKSEGGREVHRELSGSERIVDKGPERGKEFEQVGREEPGVEPNAERRSESPPELIDGGVSEGGGEKLLERPVEEALLPEHQCDKKGAPTFPNPTHLEGCKGLNKGPFKDVSLGKDHASAPEALVDHNARRFIVKAGESGYFKFDAWRGCDHYFFFDKPMKVQVEDGNGAQVPSKAPESKVRECRDVQTKWIVHLPRTQYYYFKLGPFGEDMTFSLVVDDGHSHE